MFENITKNLKGIASAILIAGIVFSGLVGFVILVGVNGLYKLFGLLLWILGPVLSLLFSIIVYGVALKDEQVKLLSKETVLLENNKEKINKIYAILLKEEKGIKNNGILDKVSSLNNNINNNIDNNETKSSIIEEKIKAEEVKIDAKDELIGEVKIETVIEEKENKRLINYKYNENECVLFDTTLTLPNGETFALESLNEKVYRVGNSIFFNIGSFLYELEMNNLYNACSLISKIENKRK